MKTLIVEDDYISRLFLWKILNKYGTVHIAVNGNEAIEAVTNAVKSGESYDLICLDIMMPELDGLTFLRKIRMMEDKKKITLEKRSTIFIISALAEDEQLIQTVKNQYDNYIGKPIVKAVLIDNIKKAGLLPFKE